MVDTQEAAAPLVSAGHSGASTVFEGIRAYWRPDTATHHIFRLEDHIERLYHSALAIATAPTVSAAAVAAGVAQVVRTAGLWTDLYIRPFTLAKHPIRDPLVDPGAPVSVAIACWSAPPPRRADVGCSAYVSSWRRAPVDVAPASVKAIANYHNGRLAVIDARDHGCDWPILLNTSGNIAESAGANIFLTRNGTLITPAKDQDILPGITRDTVLRIASELHLAVEERPVPHHELGEVDELFFTGTAWEILPITSMPQYGFATDRTGPITTAISSAYRRLVRGHTDTSMTTQVLRE